MMFYILKLIIENLLIVKNKSNKTLSWRKLLMVNKLSIIKHN